MTASLDLRNSIVLITGSDPPRFGTGFVIDRRGERSYVLTCAHVVDDVGGAAGLKAKTRPATVAAMGSAGGFDLAVLVVEAPLDVPPLPLRAVAGTGRIFATAGFYLYGKSTESKEIGGRLGVQVGLHDPASGQQTNAWPLELDPGGQLQPGYSGAPLVDSTRRRVMGVVSARQGEGKKGRAISIAALPLVWPEMPPGLLPAPGEPGERRTPGPAGVDLVAEMINREEAVERFKEFIRPGSEWRVWRLLGAGKMGKSYLLTEIFPRLARRQAGVRRANLDARNQTSLDLLHLVYGQLGGEADFPRYAAAHRDWLDRPRIKVEGLQAVLSRFSISAGEDPGETRRWTRHLTAEFAADLRALDDRLILLLFDAVDDAPLETQTWLAETLLPHLAPLEHVRTVLAGCELPEASGAYAACCRSYRLPPVEAEEAYLAYCRHLQVEVGIENIRALIRNAGYAPGAFAETIIALAPGGRTGG